MKYPIIISTTEKEGSYQSIINVNVPDIKDGLIKVVGANRFAVLMTIVAHMNNDGQAFPSQRKISELTGQSITTVNKIVNELSDIEYKGKPLLKKSIIGVNRKMTVYDLDMASIPTDEEIEEAKKDNPMNSKDVAHLFAGVYEEHFNTPYTINYGRDLSLIKNKLIGKYSDEQIRKMIDKSIKQYTEIGNNLHKYPRPTISMMTSWLGNQALTMADVEEQKDKEIENISNDSEQQDRTDEALKQLENL